MTIFDFGKGVPDSVHCDGGSLSVTTLMIKQGTGSLRWDFSEGDRLIFNTPIGYEKLIPDGKDFRVYVFGMYMFGFGAAGKLHVGFLKDGVEKTGFDIELGFHGWRSATACFERDMTGEPENDMDSMVITAIASGSLLFSEVITANRVDQRHILKSYQVPHIKNNEILFEKDWKLGKKYSETAVDTRAAEYIKEKALSYIYSEYATDDTVEFEQLEDKAKEFEIGENELGVTGKRVEWYNQRRIVDQTPLKDDSFISLRVVTNLMLEIAGYYMRTKDDRAAELYIQILKYIIVQGFAEGSSFGTHKILDYGIRPFYASALAMHEVIEKNNLTDEITSAMLWFLHACQKGFVDSIPAKRASSDDFFNSARGVLFAILMLKDKDKQAGMLAAYSDWVSDSLLCRPGLTGMFKEDGCVFHHHGHYIGYAKGGLEGITAIAYMLSGTQFNISDDAYNSLKNVMSALHFQCNGTEVPIALSGRHPTGKETIAVSVYKYFALCALEKGDRESAGLYLSLSGEPRDSMDELIFESGIKNVNEKGNRSFPLACCCVHKRKNFMAVAKGYSKYLWGSEIYVADNLYGRYRSYGVLELINGTDPFSHEGYDWNRFPGATTIHLPIEDLKANVLNVDDKSGFEEMLLSDQSFAGSVNLGDNGMFSMILSEHPKYNGSHRARKSIFFHDDFILLLGSGISNDSSFETETTLYQISMDKNPALPLLNDKEYTGEYVIKDGDILKDNFGNNYYIKPGTKVLLSLGMQKSYDSEKASRTEGEFATAVICHGKHPADESYEYGIGADGAKKPDYTILRQDDSVHAVKIGNITYMAIFEPEKCDFADANLPVMLMIEENKDDIKLAVCNPDLALYDEDESQFDENGVQREVSIYSRTWLTTPVGSKKLKLKLPSYDFSCEIDAEGGTIYNFTKEIK